MFCLRKRGDDLVESWENNQIQAFSDNNCHKDLNRIDGQLVEFEWKIFPGLTTMGILNQIQQMMGELQCEPENARSTRKLHKQDHIQVDVQKKLNGIELMKCVKNNSDTCERMWLVDSLAIIDFSGALM